MRLPNPIFLHKHLHKRQPFLVSWCQPPIHRSSNHPSTHSVIQPAIHPPIYQTIHPPTHSLTQPPILPTIHPSIHPPISAIPSTIKTHHCNFKWHLSVARREKMRASKRRRVFPPHPSISSPQFYPYSLYPSPSLSSPLPPLHLFVSQPSLIVKLSKSVIDLFPSRSFLFCVSSEWLSGLRVWQLNHSRRLIPPLCRLLIGWSEAVSCQSSACFSPFKRVTSDSSDWVNIGNQKGHQKCWKEDVWLGNCGMFGLTVGMAA